MRFIAFDFETGGLEKEKASPLTVSFIVFNHNFTRLGELDLSIKPNGKDPYLVTAEALNVNKIDLVKHDQEAIPLDEAKKRIFSFLREMSNDGETRLIPFGQNIQYDIDFLIHWFMSRGNFNKYCSYHSLDTAGLAIFFKLLRIMPVDQKTRLGELAKFFEVPTGQLHTAKEDTKACINILRNMVGKIVEVKTNE